jgi:hypothetical protein
MARGSPDVAKYNVSPQIHERILRSRLSLPTLYRKSVIGDITGSGKTALDGVKAAI